MEEEKEVKKYKNLDVINNDRRFFEAWATANIRDLEGEVVDIDFVGKYLPDFLSRNPPINLEHTNKTVGRVLSATVKKRPDGTDGVYISGEIFKDTKTEDDTWMALKNETIKGMSIGGEAERDEKGVLRKAKIWEISLVKEPALPAATIVSVNNFAKSDEMKKVIDTVDACKQNNPWAICAAQLGTSEGEKFERCVLQLKEKLGIEKSEDNSIKKNEKNEEVEGDKMEETKKEKLEGEEAALNPKVENPAKPPDAPPVDVDTKKTTEERVPVEDVDKEGEMSDMKESMARIESMLGKLIEMLAPVPPEPEPEVEAEVVEQAKAVKKSAPVVKARTPKVVNSDLDTGNIEGKKEVKKSAPNWNDMESVKAYFSN